MDIREAFWWGECILIGIANQSVLVEDARMATKRQLVLTGVWRSSAQFLAVVAAGMVFTELTVAAAPVQARRSQITLPTCPWAASKHPYFRGTDKVNIYPYPMLDFLSRDKTNRTYRTVVLENEYLRITFLPELGGKIHEVTDKTTGQPMFYVNHVIKPGLIGQCGAWTSGGVEWNTGPQGHTVSAMQPVACEILPPEKDGSRSVAIGETERIYGTKWTVVVTLRPGRSFIEERIRIYNPTEYVRPYYFWNCTAVLNTPGFRFIYPMTLGTDHGSEKFFNWPIHEGKDLSRGTNYQDASSIFAWHCDQDFFGSYDDGVDRGVVSYANHHQVPGKKAWTWGQGGFGKMHQMDLTDSDGPYNEVQTGPLLTQGEVGRLDPCEAVEWKEWWYPVHGIGGFTFANKDVAVNGSIKNGRAQLRIISTGIWRAARVGLMRGEELFAQGTCDLDPAKVAEFDAAIQDSDKPFTIEVQSKAHERIARWQMPLALPLRKPPEKKSPPQTASEFVQVGWRDLLFARIREAEKQFQQALERDTNSSEAHVGLAYASLDGDPAKAAVEARRAVEADPGNGAAHYVLAVVEYRRWQDQTALEEAWKATLQPATAIPARALVAKLLIRERRFNEVISVLAEAGPWQDDPICRNRLAVALLERGAQTQADSLVRENLRVDPLDSFAKSIAWLDLSEKERRKQKDCFGEDIHTFLDVLGQYSQIGRREIIDRLLTDVYLPGTTLSRDALADYWFLENCALQKTGWAALSNAFAGSARSLPRSALDQSAWPHRYESLNVLQNAVRLNQADGRANLLLGNLLFQMGDAAAARLHWSRAAAVGTEPVIAYRALGMAAKTLDGDLKSAREWLEKANQADNKDAIVARDLANVLFALADKADDEAGKRLLLAEARDRLKTAFDAGKGRSDFVALLARAQNRLGEYAETARILDLVRVTVWEGSHEVHDLYEDAHVALGDEHLKAGRAAEALADFDRALEYPANLATGRLENAREARINYRRGNALLALGQKQAALEAWRKAADERGSKDKAQEEARQKAKEAIENATK